MAREGKVAAHEVQRNVGQEIAQRCGTPVITVAPQIRHADDGVRAASGSFSSWRPPRFTVRLDTAVNGSGTANSDVLRPANAATE